MLCVRSKVYMCRYSRFCSVLTTQGAVVLSVVSSPDEALLAVLTHHE
jgi:hypothetical protein